uniref:VWFA domain-containing protein n=2 Tax=Panagrolaimus sp. ES5 TaxID=591445 RepID=A0AC34GVR5_9BILA
MYLLTSFLLIATLHFSLAAQGCVSQSCSPSKAQADIVFLIDTSSSLGEANFPLVQQFLYNLAADLTLGSGTDHSQLAFITFSQDAKTYGTLTQGNSLSAVNSTIASLTRGGYALREITKALKAEETIVTSANGLRTKSKKLLVAILADTFTGEEPDHNNLLTNIRGKYDALLSIGIGTNAIQFAYTDITYFSGIAGDTFFITGADQLDFARLWVERNACPTYHAPTTYVPTTIAPTQPPGVTCTLANLKYDIYLILDISNVMSTADFNALKSAVTSFVYQYSIDNGNTQVALIAVSADPQNYYTGFHVGERKSNVLTAISMLTQEPSNGQSLDLAFKVADAAYFQSYANLSNMQLVVYITGNTNFDKDPTSTISSLKSKYGLNIVTVQFTTAADKTKLQSISGGSSCTIDATTSDLRSSLPKTLEQLTCSKSFC